jgi:hypothetical protein
VAMLPFSFLYICLRMSYTLLESVFSNIFRN